MKLSKKQLTDFIVGSMRDNGENGWGSEHERTALDALRNGTLEIEGYSRDKWTRFDPNNPKTFPPCNGERFLIAAQDLLESPAFTMMIERATQKLLERMPRDIRRLSLNVYWRPLPPPPGKEEA